MKKPIMAVLTAAICMALTACSGNPAKSGITDTGQEGAGITQSEKIAEADEEDAVEQDATESEKPDRDTSYLDDVKFNVKTYKADRVEVGYIEVAGLSDSVQERLNQNIRDFYLWQWTYGQEEESDKAEYYGLATYSFVGGRLISVQRYLSITADGAAYPVNEASAQTFDVTTGDPVGALNAEPFTEEDINKFELTLPSDDVPDELAKKARQKLREYLLGTDEIYNYFLTDTNVAIYIANDVHAEGDYFIFEAEYAEVGDVLAVTIRSAAGL